MNKWIMLILCRILYNQQIIKRKVHKMATVLEKVQELALAISVAADEIAADLQRLKDQLVGAGTPEEVEAILQPIIDRLTALGQAQ
jgi:hypothetical protein